MKPISILTLTLFTLPILTQAADQVSCTANAHFLETKYIKITQDPSATEEAKSKALKKMTREAKEQIFKLEGDANEPKQIKGTFDFGDGYSVVFETTIMPNASVWNDFVILTDLEDLKKLEAKKLLSLVNDEMNTPSKPDLAVMKTLLIRTSVGGKKQILATGLASSDMIASPAQASVIKKFAASGTHEHLANIELTQARLTLTEPINNYELALQGLIPDGSPVEASINCHLR